MHLFLKSSSTDSVKSRSVFESRAPWCKLAWLHVLFHAHEYLLTLKKKKMSVKHLDCANSQR